MSSNCCSLIFVLFDVNMWKQLISERLTYQVKLYAGQPFTIFTYIIMHLVYPLPTPPPSLQFCITAVFDFSSYDCNTQEELEKNSYAKFWGVNKVHYDLCENGEYSWITYNQSVLQSTFWMTLCFLWKGNEDLTRKRLENGSNNQLRTGWPQDSDSAW